MKKLLMLGFLLIPSLVNAKTDCRYIEYPDHYVAICEGDEAYRSMLLPSPLTSDPVSGNDQSKVTVVPTQPTATVQQAVIKPKSLIHGEPFRHRQRRPSSADMLAAQSERRQLIVSHRQKEPEILPVAPFAEMPE